jgi:hypothetical protein
VPPVPRWHLQGGGGRLLRVCLPRVPRGLDVAGSLHLRRSLRAVRRAVSSARLRCRRCRRHRPRRMPHGSAPLALASSRASLLGASLLASSRLASSLLASSLPLLVLPLLCLPLLVLPLLILPLLVLPLLVLPLLVLPLLCLPLLVLRLCRYCAAPCALSWFPPLTPNPYTLNPNL